MARLSPQQRVDMANELARQAFVQLRDWTEQPDPVEQRRLQVIAATQYRAAADVLDDAGRIK
jgi:hypothetical protein